MICNSLIDLSFSFKMLNLFIQTKLNKCNNVLIIFLFSSNFFLSSKRNTVFFLEYVTDKEMLIEMKIEEKTKMRMLIHWENGHMLLVQPWHASVAPLVFSI